MKVLGVPLGRDEYAIKFLEKKMEHHDTLFHRIPSVPDVQDSWLLQSYCANLYLRNVTPEVAHSFAISHDFEVHHCLCEIIGVDPDDVSRECSTVLTSEGWGWQVQWTRDGAHWASRADSVSTMFKKDPGLAATVLIGLNAEADGCFAVVNQCADRLGCSRCRVANMGRSRRRRHA